MDIRMAYKLHISDLKLNQFSETEIKYIESLIFSKIDKKGKEVS